MNKDLCPECLGKKVIPFVRYVRAEDTADHLITEPRTQPCPKCCLQKDKDVCPECKGEKWVSFPPPCQRGSRLCPTCLGTGRGQFKHNRNADCDDCHGTGLKDNKVREKIADKIFLSAQRFVCLDVCMGCCNFGIDRECQHENAIGKWADMIECPQDRLVANTLADQIIAFIPDKEEIVALRKRLTELEEKLDDREADLLKATEDEREGITAIGNKLVGAFRVDAHIFWQRVKESLGEKE